MTGSRTCSVAAGARGCGPAAPESGGSTKEERCSSRAAGFTIVEVVVASSLMLLVICGLLLAFMVAKKNAVAASNFEAATVLARGTLERISTTSFANIASYGPVAITSGSILSQIQGAWVQVVVTNVTGMKQVQVNVTWTNLAAGSGAGMSLVTAVSGY